MQTPIVDAGMATPSGMSSVGAPGQETPELIELRKRRIEQDMEGGETPNLYTILPEKKTDRMGAGMFFTIWALCSYMPKKFQHPILVSETYQLRNLQFVFIWSKQFFKGQ